MKHGAIILGLVLMAALALPGVALAQDRVPVDGAFHIDVRALTFFDIDLDALVRDDDPEDTEADATYRFVLGNNSGVGGKIGYLIAGHHDVGGHLALGYYQNVGVFDPEDDDIDETVIRTDGLSFRLAAYYNYNFHAHGWLMPYVGPLVGIDITTATTVDESDDAPDDNGVTTTSVSPIFGLEGGIKLFPYEHVAFDIGLVTTYGLHARKTSFENDDFDDDDWAGGTFDLGVHAGLNIYF